MDPSSGRRMDCGEREQKPGNQFSGYYWIPERRAVWPQGKPLHSLPDCMRTGTSSTITIVPERTELSSRELRMSGEKAGLEDICPSWSNCPKACGMEDGLGVCRYCTLGRRQERDVVFRVEDEAGEYSGVHEKSKWEEAGARRTLEKWWGHGWRKRGSRENSIKPMQGGIKQAKEPMKPVSPAPVTGDRNIKENRCILTFRKLHVQWKRQM